ncbi:MAG: DUF2812 domain-containing protein [Erysipelotrichaceae bacterium]|nr:DUF2812 domain-containing protein [Erysipelotrichaceae bacterium]
MNLSRNEVSATRSPWDGTDKISSWLEDKAKEGWFVDSFSFKMFNSVISFHFVRCKPVQATIVYEEVSSILWNQKNYEDELPEDCRFVWKAENYAIYTDTIPELVDDDIK